tara:strand:- start:14631 stop:14903 length:273 start_codon:yes stop_codon:yes gene_type:complete
VRLLSAVTRAGVVAFVLVLLRETMDPSNWPAIEEAPQPSTLDLANALFDEWAVATIVLGALLAMAMIGASYLVRDERLINLVWDMGGDDQ